MARTLSRRRLLQAGGLAALAAGCAPRTPSGGRTVGAEEPVLRIVNWTDYIADETVPSFVEQTGIDTDYVAGYDSNDALIADHLDRWAEGTTRPADLTVPTNWLAERLRDDGRLARVPLELVPNHVNLEPALLGLPWDRGARWHLPWQVGYTGLAWHAGRVGRELRSVEDLFDRRLDGRVAIVGEWREAVGLVMLAAGDDPARATRDAAEAALDRIEALVPRSAGISYDVAGMLADGRVDAAMGWSGDVALTQLDAPDVQFAFPVEGAIRWFDTMVIPAGAAHPGNAARFMDFVYDPANAADLTEFVLFSSPVLGVREELERTGRGELASDPLIFPDDLTARRLVTWGGMSRAHEDAIESRFLAVTAAAPEL